MTARACLVTLAAVVGVAGCTARVGTACDDDAAHTVVYRRNGMPAYLGQALINQSCGRAVFCHSATADDRHGVPFGLDYDVSPLAVDLDEDVAGARARLAANRTRLLHDADRVYASVVERSMPPGELGREYERTLYYEDPNDGSTGIDGIDTPEGQDALRNWLACGAPVIERADLARFDDRCTSDADCEHTHECRAGGRCREIGDYVPLAEIEAHPDDFGWVYDAILDPSCALGSRCHGRAVDGHSGGDLDMSTALVAYTNLLSPARDADNPTVSEREIECLEGRDVPARRVVPHDLNASFLRDKVRDEADCGSEMPIGPPLLTAELEAIDAWITLGAPGPTPAD